MCAHERMQKKATQKTKGKVGEACKEPADCQNNNCVNNVCTRKNAKKVVQNATQAQNKTKKVKVGMDCNTSSNCYTNNCGESGKCESKAKKSKQQPQRNKHL